MDSLMWFLAGIGAVAVIRFLIGLVNDDAY